MEIRMLDPMLLDALLTRATGEHVTVRVKDLLVSPSRRDTLPGQQRPLPSEPPSRAP